MQIFGEYILPKDLSTIEMLFFLISFIFINNSNHIFIEIFQNTMNTSNTFQEDFPLIARLMLSLLQNKFDFVHLMPLYTKNILNYNSFYIKEKKNHYIFIMFQL